ncbi:MAG: hypothetical protein PHD43_23965 [Methylococcales bacterium]|nr:hypothetical protein [Methylococcales bacterium]
MESTNPSPSSSSHQPDAGKEGTPFAQATVQISKQEHVQLKWGNRYWQRQHGRALERIAELKQELECAQAEIRDLKQRLYGKHSEKGTTLSETQADDTTIPPRPRGEAKATAARLDHTCLCLRNCVLCRPMNKPVPCAMHHLTSFREQRTPTSSKSM